MGASPKKFCVQGTKKKSRDNEALVTLNRDRRHTFRRGGRTGRKNPQLGKQGIVVQQGGGKLPKNQKAAQYGNRPLRGFWEVTLAIRVGMRADTKRTFVDYTSPIGGR